MAAAYIRWARDDDCLLFIGLFAGTVLVNGILAIVMIEFMEWLGLWSPITDTEPSGRMGAAPAAGHSGD